MNRPNDPISTRIHESLSRQLSGTDYDLVDVVPIPMGGDRMVRMRTIEEALLDFDGYLIQVRPRRNQEARTDESVKHHADAIYLPDGKLNSGYLLRNAELLCTSGEYALARNIYKAIVQSGERTAAALRGIGRCYEGEGKLEEARLSYEESIAYHPHIDVYRQLASLLVRQRKDQNAAEVMERALNLKDLPQQVRYELHQASGNCYTRLKRIPEAERHFLRALDINPAATEIRTNLGALYLQSRKTAEAKRHFQDAVASNPGNDRALIGIATCLLDEGEKRAAHDHFAKALEIQLNNPTAIFYLVKCAYEIKSYATAARLLEEYVQIAPVNTNLLYSLAGLQFHLGRMETARATCRQILELSPLHAGATELLSMMERFGEQRI